MSDEKDDKWEMPAPVFRSSTGSLPRSLEETISHSFMPNAETIEIDEDDILSIMDKPAKGPDAEVRDFPAGEIILDVEAEITLPIEAHADGVAPEAEPDHKPVVVTAKDPVENLGSNVGDPKSDLVIYILFALVLAGIIAAVIYYRQ